MDVFESAPAAALLGMTFVRKVQTLTNTLCWLIQFLLLDFGYGRLAVLWHCVTFCQKVTCLWQPIHKFWCSKIMRLWIRCFRNDPEYSRGKKVENWVRTNEILQICQKVVLWPISRAKLPIITSDKNAPSDHIWKIQDLCMKIQNCQSVGCNNGINSLYSDCSPVHCGISR